MEYGSCFRTSDRLGVFRLMYDENELLEEELSGEEVFGEVVEVEDRPFLSTPLNDYTVTEGLLLIIAVLLIFGFIRDALKGGFWWLW